MARHKAILPKPPRTQWEEEDARLARSVEYRVLPAHSTRNSPLPYYAADRATVSERKFPL